MMRRKSEVMKAQPSSKSTRLEAEMAVRTGSDIFYSSDVPRVCGDDHELPGVYNTGEHGLGTIHAVQSPSTHHHHGHSFLC